MATIKWLVATSVASWIVVSRQTAMILSPAHGHIFSPFDAAVGHFHRYSRLMVQRISPALHFRYREGTQRDMRHPDHQFR
jgi:hypothetical protein